MNGVKPNLATEEKRPPFFWDAEMMELAKEAGEILSRNEDNAPNSQTPRE